KKPAVSSDSARRRGKALFRSWSCRMKHEPNARQAVRFLVVDDDETFRMRLSRALAAREFETHHAGDAASALEMARRVRPGRAVVDLRMPGASGLDLIRELIAVDPDIEIV